VVGTTGIDRSGDDDEAVYLGQRVIIVRAVPTRVAEDPPIDLPAACDQLITRSDSRSAELGAQVHAQIQKARPR